MTLKITDEMLFLKLGLYEPISFAEDLDAIGKIVSNNDLQFDCYCVECKKESTFILHQKSYETLYYNGMTDEEKRKSLTPRTLPLQFQMKCQRNGEHKYFFSFLIEKYFVITKIGQYPSIASIQAHSIKKYQGILKQDYRDFSKSIGLFSHGIGAGSFVYLRRIFENLIHESKLEASKQSTWDEAKFNKSIMDVKIKMLEDFLPSFVVENRSIYKILSKGIHELTEKECLSLFPNVQLAIELILDDKIHLIEKQKKIISAREFISKTIEKLS